MNYTLEIRPAAQRAMLRLSGKLRARIDARIMSLASNPRPVGCVKLAGNNNLYRVRVGDYRVVYEILDDMRVVIVTLVAHRRDVYRGL